MNEIRETKRKAAQMTVNDINRRTVLIGVAGAAAIGATATALAACSNSDTPDAESVSTTADGIGGAAPATNDSGGALGVSSDVAVGGGMIYEDQGVVVTQPSDGVFKAFSTVCTHQGCSVTSIKDGAIVCPCHNSLFSITDGSVLGGPATEPLPEKTVTVTGDAITLG
ncbi:Rieske (2Fe-2S) protein [Williamsia muralis]|uniref:Cytochrome bc1 complex Rieske iron-sulfur subunit n=1 Tax=Williamsia marianensis TaxID=85044 RepID=A0ABU4EZV4_WILMA|nr:Rieske (2Fe-2S) protein [Williamsia muralis]MDV7136792.1 Rieske (2Fe-2S) protein [Williamsia muralis]